MAYLAAEVDAVAAIRARAAEEGISLCEALARIWIRLARGLLVDGGRGLHEAACAKSLAVSTAGSAGALTSAAEVPVARDAARARVWVGNARAMPYLAAEVDAIAAVRARAAEEGISLCEALARIWIRLA